MDTVLRLADVLERFMKRIEWTCTPGLLSKRSGVPKATIVNWLEGRVARPRHWQDLVHVAAALALNAADTNQLLKSAGYASLHDLAGQASNEQERALLNTWAHEQSDSAAPLPRLSASSLLPQPLTPLIGREHEVASICALLQRTDIRLLTLSGAGGTGKTRLATQVAGDVSSAFADGVYWIALASVMAPDLVAATIAGVLGVSEGNDQPLLARLKEVLRDRQALLVLDNFEQVLAAAALVAELLAAAPRLKIMITSRVVLHLSGEQEFPVPPLALPDPSSRLSAERLARYPAVDLFVRRVQACRPDFALTEENAAAVASICARLDGLPLALELAAARSKLLTPSVLLDRLGRQHVSSLQLLTGGPRDLPARQQTLYNTITWSYDLLDPAAQRLFARLAVFVGGCTLEAAEAVCSTATVTTVDAGAAATSGQNGTTPLFDHQVLEGLATLVDHSLLEYREMPDGTRRFVFLDTIRAYALECLERSGEAETIRQRHAAYYLALAEQARPMLKGAEQCTWMARLDAEHDNLRAALTWYIDHDAEAGTRLAYGIYYFWEGRGYLTEGRLWSQALLEQVPEPTRARAVGLDLVGTLAYKQGDDISAQLCHEESIAIRRMLFDHAGIACSLNILGHVAGNRGNYAAARAYYEESLSMRRAMNDQPRIALSLDALGQVLVAQGDLDCAAVRYAESLALKRTLGDHRGISTTLRLLGDLAYRRGDALRADELYREGLQLTRTLGLGYPEGRAWLLYHLGELEQARGDVVQAITYFQESLTLFRRLDLRPGIMRCLAALDQALDTHEFGDEQEDDHYTGLLMAR